MIRSPLNREAKREESLAFLDKLYGFIAKEAYLASADYAQEKGPFTKFQRFF